MTTRPPAGTTLPTGTVTFLFTDIEGSTRLVQSLGDQYAELLADHCRILRNAIAGADGVEVGTEGDSFFAVFREPQAAVDAALAAQRAVAAHDWPGSAQVRVRMGVHTGEGKLGGDNYLGLDVHRAARIAAAGHGAELGDDAIIGRFLAAEGYMAFMSDDLPRARALLEEGLTVAQRQGDQGSIAIGHHTVAQVARLDGRLTDAADHYREALRYWHRLGDAAQLTEPLQGLAAVAIASGDPQRGVRLLGANAAIRERLGGGPPPEWLRLGDPLTDAKEEVGEATYQRAWEDGLQLSVDDAVALAMGR